MSNKLPISYIAHGGVGETDFSKDTKEIVTNLTGSFHELRAKFRERIARVGIDLGGYQGKGKLERDVEALSSWLDALILTHPHLDHIGDYPILFADGKKPKFPVYATPETISVMQVALIDAAKLMMREYEEQKRIFNEKRGDIKLCIKIVKAYEGVKGISRDKSSNSHRQSDDNSLVRYEKAKELLSYYGVDAYDVKWEKTFGPSRPKYDMEAVMEACSYITPIDLYNQEWTEILPGNLSFRFTNAGHIIGSASPIIRLTEEDKEAKILFSGDIGALESDLHPSGLPTPPMNEEIDAVFMESTYGGRKRASFEAGLKEYEDSLIEAFEGIKNGNPKYERVIHACFSLDRLQNILFRVMRLKKAWKIPVPVYVDSPTGAAYIKMYKNLAEKELVRLSSPESEHIRNIVWENYVVKQRKILQEYIEALTPGEETFIVFEPETQDDRWDFAESSERRVVITASGMANGGPIISHLRAWADDDKTAFYFPGYLAEGTLANKLADPDIQGKSDIEIDGKKMSIEARMKQFTFLSGHASESDILAYLRSISYAEDASIFLVHGDVTTSSAALKNTLKRNELSPKIFVPRLEEKHTIYGEFVSLPSENIPKKKAKVNTNVSDIRTKNGAANVKSELPKRVRLVLDNTDRSASWSGNIGESKALKLAPKLDEERKRLASQADSIYGELHALMAKLDSEYGDMDMIVYSRISSGRIGKLKLAIADLEILEIKSRRVTRLLNEVQQKERQLVSAKTEAEELKSTDLNQRKRKKLERKIQEVDFVELQASISSLKNEISKDENIIQDLERNIQSHGLSDFPSIAAFGEYIATWEKKLWAWRRVRLSPDSAKKTILSTISAKLTELPFWALLRNLKKIWETTILKINEKREFLSRPEQGISMESLKQMSQDIQDIHAEFNAAQHIYSKLEREVITRSLVQEFERN